MSVSSWTTAIRWTRDIENPQLAASVSDKITRLVELMCAFWATLMNHLDLKARPDLPSTPSNPERTNVNHRLDRFRSNCRIHRE
jgi:hypothetical protein